LLWLVLWDRVFGCVRAKDGWVFWVVVCQAIGVLEGSS
jgi:hypothetical protein